MRKCIGISGDVDGRHTSTADQNAGDLSDPERERMGSTGALRGRYLGAHRRAASIDGGAENALDDVEGNAARQ